VLRKAIGWFLVTFGVFVTIYRTVRGLTSGQRRRQDRGFALSAVWPRLALGRADDNDWAARLMHAVLAD
jgi:hypothetical protein